MPWCLGESLPVFFAGYIYTPLPNPEGDANWLYFLMDEETYNGYHADGQRGGPLGR